MTKYKLPQFQEEVIDPKIQVETITVDVVFIVGNERKGTSILVPFDENSTHQTIMADVNSHLEMYKIPEI